jgi:hypothetical protein
MATMGRMLLLGTAPMDVLDQLTPIDEGEILASVELELS